MHNINEETLADHLSERADFFYCALSFLISRNPDSIIPEVTYFMHPDQIITFLHTFGGRTLKIPTVSEFSLDMHCALAAYYRTCHEMPWPSIQEKLKIDKSKLNTIQARIQEWLEKINRDNMSLPKFLTSI